MKLFTVGYEGSDIQEFTSSLKRQGIRQVADLRKNPISRKRGFSKRLLGEALALQEIAYIHLPGLGVPTEWRKQAKEELITRKKMFKDYVKKILPKQTEDIEVLQKLMHRKGLALLCYEADASDCHRSFVAQELVRREKSNVKIVDIDIHADTKNFKLFKQPRRSHGNRKAKSSPTRATRKNSARDRAS